MDLLIIPIKVSFLITFMNKEVTVFIIEDSSKSNFGGGQKVTLETLHALKGKYNTILFDTNLPTLFKRRAIPLVDEFNSIKLTGKLLSGRFQLGELIMFPFELIQNTIKLIMAVNQRKRRDERILLYATTKKTLLFAALAAIILKKPYIYHAHTIETGKSFLFQLKKVFYSKAKVIICVSNLVKDRLQLSNTIVIHNPIELPVNSFPKSIDSKKQFIVAAFATLTKEKGLEYLMKSYAYLPEDLRDNVHIHVYGMGAEYEYLSEFQNDNVQLKGFCEDVEKKLFEEVDISVIPSVIEESFGMVSIESFRFGVPVICTNIGGLVEIVEDGYNGLCVSVRNERAIAKNISYLLKTPEVYNKLSINAIQSSKQYSLAVYSDKMMKCFEDAMYYSKD